MKDGRDPRCKAQWSTYAKAKRAKGWGNRKVVAETVMEAPADIELVELANLNALPKAKHMWEWTGDLNIGLSLIAFRGGKRPTKVYHFVDSFKHNCYWAVKTVEVTE